MHDIGIERSIFGDMTITHAKASGTMVDPFDGLNSDARNRILFAPLNRHERELVRAARKLPREDRRVIAHYLLTSRRRDYEEEQEFLAREAKRLRDQDIVDSENARQARHLDWLARSAEASVDPAVSRKKMRPGKTLDR